jgi:uncharacterized membrane protein HdeD (DUF308 family)
MQKNFFTSVWSSVPMAVLTALFGLVLLIWPSLSSALICYALSAGVLLYGLFRIAVYFRNKPQNALEGRDFASGLMLVALALLILIKTELVISLLPMLLGLLLLLGTARETQVAVDLYRLRESRWFLPLIAGLIQGILGLLILLNPFSTAMLLMQFIGASVLVESVSQIIFAAMLSRRR